MKIKDVKVLIGTSGWMYKHWKGPFYSKSISNDEMLSFYAKHLSTVEINNTFYKLPTSEAVKKWRDRSPNNFIFSIKANQYITHRKYLKDGQETVKNLLNPIKILDHKLGPILFQFPPNWQLNIERLKEFIETLPTNYHFVFEMRNPTWYSQDVYNLLRKYNIALCIHDFSGEVTPHELTADFTYIRFHGPIGIYYGKYSSDELKQWASVIKKWLNQDITLYAYFNNDAYGWAVENALELKKLLE